MLRVLLRLLNNINFIIIRHILFVGADKEIFSTQINIFPVKNFHSRIGILIKNNTELF
jgi:hypothetical protein